MIQNLSIYIYILINLSLELMLETTSRIIQLSVTNLNIIPNELIRSSNIRGASMSYSKALRVELWPNRRTDPDQSINSDASIICYQSSIASECLATSRLYQSTGQKASYLFAINNVFLYLFI